MSPPYRAALAAIDADPNQRLLVVEHDGVAVGTMQLTFIPGIAYREQSGISVLSMLGGLLAGIVYSRNRPAAPVRPLHTAWMPQPCSSSDMAAPSMQFGPGAGGATGVAVATCAASGR